MSLILSHWTLSPLTFVAMLALGAHEVGLTRLGTRTVRARPQRRRRAWLFRLGIAVVVVASSSPLAWWGMRLLTIHMIDHVMLMFFAPLALMAGGPLVPLLFSLPVGARRRLIRTVRGKVASPLRGTWRAASSPLGGFLCMNVVMVAWHIPVDFNAAMSSPAVHGLVMEPSFVLAGLLFWRSIVASHPYRPRARLRTQLLMVVGTNLEMLLLAMAMSIFTTTAWYSAMTGGVAMHMMPGMTMPVAHISFAQQQAAAAVLWICGDFWALPTTVVLLRRSLQRHGSALSALEQFIDRIRVAPAP